MNDKRDIEYSDGLTIKDVDVDLADELDELVERRAVVREPMDLVKFYRGEIGTGDNSYDHPHGYKWDEIMGFNYFQLESYHRWVTWCFPTKERSFFNPDVPLLTDEVIKIFREDEDLQIRTKDTFRKILDFYGFESKEDGEFGVQLDEASGGTHKNPLWAVKGFNHNYLRITRILTSLRYFGHDEWSKKWQEALFKFAVYDEQTKAFWEGAATGELP